MKSRETRRGYIFACLTILGLALLANIENSADRAFATENELIPVDFPVFYMGGKVALQRGATPLYYPLADRRQGYTLLYGFADDATPWAQMARANGFPQIREFTNPPFSAVLMAPLAMLPWRAAFLVWQIIIISLTAAAIFLTLRLLPSGPGLGTLAIVFTAACFFFPFRNNLVCGQVNVSILFLWTLGVYLLQRQRPMASVPVLRLGDSLKNVAGGRRTVPRPPAAVAVAGSLRGGSGCFHRGFHLAIRLADKPDLADGDLPEHFLRAGKCLQPLTCRPCRCAVRSPVFRPTFPYIPSGLFLPD